jgi:hypothetical protein
MSSKLSALHCNTHCQLMTKTTPPLNLMNNKLSTKNSHHQKSIKIDYGILFLLYIM